MIVTPAAVGERHHRGRFTLDVTGIVDRIGDSLADVAGIMDLLEVGLNDLLTVYLATAQGCSHHYGGDVSNYVDDVPHFILLKKRDGERRRPSREKMLTAKCPCFEC